MNVLKQDLYRRSGKGMPLFQRFFRKSQTGFFLFKPIYIALYRSFSAFRHIEVPRKTKIGGGLYFGHAFGITINGGSIIGCNCNIHKGVTIGRENRGFRKGTPIIGNRVWIGINSTIVGAISIGDDVLIAPNTFVNRDIPSHSVVFGNPCIVKHRDAATDGYVNNPIEI